VPARRVTTFSSLDEGELGLIEHSTGRLALVVREGSAAETTGTRPGSVVELAWRAGIPGCCCQDLRLWRAAISRRTLHEMGADGEGADAEGAGTADAQERRIPEATVVRLPVYQRILADLVDSDITTVSSDELAARAGVNAAKVRRDLSLFGSFGTRGTGYDAAFLSAQIERVLGADRDWPVVIVGMGNLGRALANSEGFRSHGFRVTGVYDVDPSVVGTTVGESTVGHVDDLALATGIAPIGVITTPAAAAQFVADLLVAGGTDAILNFAPRVLAVPDRVLVRNVDLSIELQAMSFFLARRAVVAPGPDLRNGAGTS